MSALRFVQAEGMGVVGARACKVSFQCQFPKRKLNADEVDCQGYSLLHLERQHMNIYTVLIYMHMKFIYMCGR